MVIPATIISCFLGSINGYVLTKWRFPGSDVIFFLLLFGMFIPYQSILIPLVEDTAAAAPVREPLGPHPHAHRLRHPDHDADLPQLLRRHPDGARGGGEDRRRFDLRHLHAIIFPLSLPGFVVVAIWQFTSIWNDFLFAATITSNPNVQPVTVALNNLAGSYIVEWNVQMAGALIAALPTLLVYIVLGRFFMRGLMAGALRGSRAERAMARVNYDNVTKRFGDVVAVNDLTLEIEDKEFLVLVGPSGCGKSTVIRLLAGLETLTAGNVYIGDEMVNDLPARDRDIAMVFQSYALYPHMSVFDNMAFGLKMHGTPKDEIHRRVLEAADILGHRGPAQAQARAALRWPAPARRARPGDRPRAAGVPVRRAALQPRRQAASADPHRTEQAAPTSRDDVHLRHPRPGGSDDDGDPHRRDQGRDPAAGGNAGGPLLPPGQRLRRRVHRQPVDELLPDAVVKGTAEQLYLDTQAFQIKVPPEKAPVLVPYVGQTVVFGIRPEDIHDAEFLPAHVRSEPVRARVDVTEMMGNEKFLHLLADDQKCLARVDPRTRARAGQEVQLAFDVDHMHAFDAQSQLAIGTTGDSVASALD